MRRRDGEVPNAGCGRRPAALDGERHRLAAAAATGVDGGIGVQRRRDPGAAANGGAMTTSPVSRAR
ncbi:MAG TPA: hypothetical protein VFS60_02445 [Thermoanaerobaculia bacterium]|nr:hypothetical protein [Thermoanaerobaculia bacterium]